MKKLLLLMIIGVMFLGFLGATEQSLPNAIQQGKIANLQQTCDSCTYVNLTRVYFPNSTIAWDIEVEMIKDGNDYNYEFNNTLALGTYSYTTCGDVAGTRLCQPVTFEVTPSGNSGNSNIVFIIFVILLLYCINLLGFFNENVMMTVLGGMALLFLGVYMINNGIIIYRDNLTNYVGYVTIAWGGMSSIFALYKEYFDD